MPPDRGHESHVIAFCFVCLVGLVIGGIMSLLAMCNSLIWNRGFIGSWGSCSCSGDALPDPVDHFLWEDEVQSVVVGPIPCLLQVGLGEAAICAEMHVPTSNKSMINMFPESRGNRCTCRMISPIQMTRNTLDTPAKGCAQRTLELDLVGVDHTQECPAEAHLERVANHRWERLAEAHPEGLGTTPLEALEVAHLM